MNISKNEQMNSDHENSQHKRIVQIVTGVATLALLLSVSYRALGHEGHVDRDAQLACNTNSSK